LFQVHGLTDLFGVPSREVTNHAYDADAVLGKPIRELSSAWATARPSSSGFQLQITSSRKWMIRLYVLSWAGIVGDRIIPDMTFVSQRIGVDALNDICGWANWAVPLMFPSRIA